MDKQKSIEALQFFVTGLSEGAFVHKVQGSTSATTRRRWNGWRSSSTASSTWAAR